MPGGDSNGVCVTRGHHGCAGDVTIPITITRSPVRQLRPKKSCVEVNTGPAGSSRKGLFSPGIALP